MRFIPVEKAKGFKIGDEVFTKDADGNYGIGRLHSRNETTEGLKLKFRVPNYDSITPAIVDNVTEVAVIRKPKAQPDAGQE